MLDKSDMVSMSLDTLRMKLKGKTKTEIKVIVGSPDRIVNSSGKECWIYGNTNTSRDRGIVFDGERVLTVTNF